MHDDPVPHPFVCMRITHSPHKTLHTTYIHTYPHIPPPHLRAWKHSFPCGSEVLALYSCEAFRPEDDGLLVYSVFGCALSAVSVSLDQKVPLGLSACYCVRVSRPRTFQMV